jgi:hypothetical protein
MSIGDKGSPSAVDILEPVRKGEEKGVAPNIFNLDSRSEMYLACLICKS